MSVTQSIQAIPRAVRTSYSGRCVDGANPIPGAVTFGNKQPVAQSVQIRGSGIVQSSASDAQSPVGYYVDDIPYVDISTPNPPPIDTFDLERIEILRALQGTTYGQDASAGSLIMRTNPVDLENFGYKVRASYSKTKGTPGSLPSRAVVNLPIVEDVFVSACLTKETTILAMVRYLVIRTLMTFSPTRGTPAPKYIGR